VTQLVAEKEQERRNLDEKREMLETILNDKDTAFKAGFGKSDRLSIKFRIQQLSSILI
jgi:hypothetical protein